MKTWLQATTEALIYFNIYVTLKMAQKGINNLQLLQQLKKQNI